MAASTSSGERVERLRQQCEKSNHIIKYLMTGKYEEGSSESHKRVVRGQAKKHSYDEISKCLDLDNRKRALAVFLFRIDIICLVS